MAQVSRRVLPKDVGNRIQSLFLKAVSHCNNEVHVTEFVADLLTPTEQIMVAKRLCIAFLLIKGKSYEYIMNVLKVSRSTVGFVALTLKEKGEGYRRTSKKIIRQEEFARLFDRLDELFEDIVMPPRGPEHRRIRNRIRLEKQINQPPF